MLRDKLNLMFQIFYVPLMLRELFIGDNNIKGKDSIDKCAILLKTKNEAF